MQELIKNGIPIDRTSLRAWNSFATTLTHNKFKGAIYHIASGGFMAQFTKQSGGLDNVEIIFDYHNPNKNPTSGSIIFYDEGGKTCKSELSFPPTGASFELLTYTIPAQVALNQLAIEIRNAQEGPMDIAIISLSGALSDNVEDAVTNEDFIRCAILYGTDANKPKLR